MMHDQIKNALLLTKHLFSAEGVMFYWVNEQQQLANISEYINVPDDFIERYHLEMQDHDPLNVKNFLKKKDLFNSLTHCRETEQQQPTQVYENFIHSYGIEETFDILFWKNNHAYAGIGITNPHLNAVSAEEMNALHQVLEANFLQMDEIRQQIIWNYLEGFKLTYREKQVCMCLFEGCSNQQISEKMGITVGTVKIYIYRILDKMGVSCRLQDSKQMMQCLAHPHFNPLIT